MTDTTEPDILPADERPETATVHIKLVGDDGEPNGKTKAIKVRQPHMDQLAAFDKTAYEFRLFHEAWQAGAEFTDDERGRMFAKMINGMNVFTASAYDREWVESALGSRTITFVTLAEAIGDARDALGIPAAATEAGADVVVS